MFLELRFIYQLAYSKRCKYCYRVENSRSCYWYWRCRWCDKRWYGWWTYRWNGSIPRGHRFYAPGSVLLSLTKPPPKWRLAEKQVCPRPFLVGHSQGSSGGMEAQGGGFCLGPCGWPFCFGLGDSVNAWSQELWIPRVHAAPAVTWPERSQRGVVSGCHRSRDISSRQPLPHPGLGAQSRQEGPYS